MDLLNRVLVLAAVACVGVVIQAIFSGLVYYRLLKSNRGASYYVGGTHRWPGGRCSLNETECICYFDDGRREESVSFRPSEIVLTDYSRRGRDDIAVSFSIPEDLAGLSPFETLLRFDVDYCKISESYYQSQIYGSVSNDPETPNFEGSIGDKERVTELSYSTWNERLKGMLNAVPKSEKDARLILEHAQEIFLKAEKLL